MKLDELLLVSKHLDRAGDRLWGSSCPYPSPLQLYVGTL